MLTLLALLSTLSPGPCPPGTGLFPPAPCVVVTYPAPTGETADLVEWMTPASGTFQPGTMVGHVWPGMLGWTKFDRTGDYLDVWTYDDDFVYFYATISPGDLVRAGTRNDTPWLPRIVSLGSPGTRLVTKGDLWQEVKSCVPGDLIQGTNIVTELWGPFDYSGPTSNLGHVTAIEMREYWDCHGDLPETCTQRESFVYAKPYGWIGWFYYTSPKRDGDFQPAGGGAFDRLEPGTSTLHDWCVSPSLFWRAQAPGGGHRPIDPGPGTPLTR